MEYESLDVLELKINQTLELIGKLKRENEWLREEKLRLEGIVEDQNTRVSSLEEELAKFQEAGFDSEKFREQQEALKSKVEGMLTKLNNLQPLL